MINKTQVIKDNDKNIEACHVSYWTIAVVSAIFLAILSVFAFLDWRIREVSKWGKLEEAPEFSKRIGLISSIFNKNMHHLYFALDYKDYSSEQKLLEDMKIDQAQIIEQLKKSSIKDDEIQVSLPGKVFKSKGPTQWSDKTQLFNMKGGSIEVKTSDEKFEAALKAVTYWPAKSRRSIRSGSRPIFSIRSLNALLKSDLLDCTRIQFFNSVLIEKDSISQPEYEKMMNAPVHAVIADDKGNTVELDAENFTELREKTRDSSRSF